VADTLSASGTLHNEDVRMPYNDSTLADPDALAYDYVTPSLANHYYFDAPFYIELNSFIEPPKNSFPCHSSSTEASNQDSPYSSSKTWSVTANSKDDGSNKVFQDNGLNNIFQDDGLNNVFQGHSTSNGLSHPRPPTRSLCPLQRLLHLLQPRT